MTTPCYVDTETTGTEAFRHHVFEVALIVGDETYHRWMNVDLSTADANALRMNRYYERLGSHGIQEAEPVEVAHEVARLTSGRQLVAFNPSFDAAFLESLLGRHGLVPAWDYHHCDLVSMASGWVLHMASLEPDPETAQKLRTIGMTPWSSTELSAAVGVDKSQFDAHTAVGDALIHQAVHQAMTTPGAPVEHTPKRRPKQAAAVPEAETPAAKPAARVGGLVRPAPQPTPPVEPDPDPDPADGPDDVEPDDTEPTDDPRRDDEVRAAEELAGRPLVPPAMPAPEGDDYSCRECGDPITRMQAIKTWSRFREFLCQADFAEWRN